MRSTGVIKIMALLMTFVENAGYAPSTQRIVCSPLPKRVRWKPICGMLVVAMLLLKDEAHDLLLYRVAGRLPWIFMYIDRNSCGSIRPFLKVKVLCILWTVYCRANMACIQITGAYRTPSRGFMTVAHRTANVMAGSPFSTASAVLPEVLRKTVAKCPNDAKASAS